LIEAIAAQPGDDPSASPATIYYRQWLVALEKLLLDKALLAKSDLDARAEDLLHRERE
jgi:hypothetical protein